MPPKLLSALLLASFLLISCTAARRGVHDTREPSAKERARLAAQARQEAIESFRGQFSRVVSPRVITYLTQLEARLESAGQMEDEPCARPKIVLLASSKLFAFSGADGTILVSTGLAHALPTEAELMFVLAHEYAHIQLRHATLPTEEYLAPEANQALQRLELEADRRGIELLARAGYLPRSAPDSLMNAYRAAGYVETSDVAALSQYPSLQRRLTALLSYARAVPSASSTTSTREHARFRGAIAPLA